MHRSVLGSIQNAHASEDCAKNSDLFVFARQDRATQSSSVSKSTFRFLVPILAANGICSLVMEYFASGSQSYIFCHATVASSFSQSELLLLSWNYYVLSIEKDTTMLHDVDLLASSCTIFLLWG
jgi:hypothetical protein